MLSGWRYRVVGAWGVIVLTVAAVFGANHPISQDVFTTYVPLFWRLNPEPLSGGALHVMLAVTLVFVLVALIPLYKPQPRRHLDTISLAGRQVVVAMLGLATLGYYNFSYRVPRATLTMIGAGLLVLVPAWFVWIRRRPNGSVERAVIVGDDPEQIERVATYSTLPLIGLVAPSTVSFADDEAGLEVPVLPDGGHVARVPRIGGLSRLEDILVENDVDVAVLAFRSADRGEFFGALDTCYEHGVGVQVHRDFSDSVLVSEGGSGELVDVDIQPWDPQDYAIKRVFDVVFSIVGLVCAIPLMAAIAVAIKLEDRESILYTQERTAGFGESFPVYKFRTMIEDAEAASGPKLSEEDNGNIDPRVTRVGAYLRSTHLDEIPQLWCILVGHMSVVGPRPERPDLEVNLLDGGVEWEKRWFVKPGLTGLAQIHDVTGYEPNDKLRHDLEYIRRRTIWLDMKIVIRQIWNVLRNLN